MRAPSAAVISGTADDRRSSAPILASRARSYAASGPNRTSRSWPPARIRSGLAVLLISVITSRGRVVHCHHTDREQDREAGLANPGSSLRLARGGGLLAERALAVHQSAPQQPIVELVKVEMAVERGRLIVHRDNDHRSRSELAAPSALRCSVPGSGRAPRPGDRRQLAGPLPGRAATCSASLAVLTTSDRAGELTAAGRPGGPVAGDDGALGNTGDHRLRRQRDGAIRQLRTP